jgi:hypothetical protein
MRPSSSSSAECSKCRAGISARRQGTRGPAAVGSARVIVRPALAAGRLPERANPARTDGTALANRSMALPAAREGRAEVARLRSSVAATTDPRTVVSPLAGRMAATRCGLARPLFNKGAFSKGMLSRAAIRAGLRRLAGLRSRAALAARDPVVAGMPVAEEATATARIAASGNEFDFFPQARASTSQRARALFFCAQAGCRMDPAHKIAGRHAGFVPLAVDSRLRKNREQGVDVRDGYQ